MTTLTVTYLDLFILSNLLKLRTLHSLQILRQFVFLSLLSPECILVEIHTQSTPLICYLQVHLCLKEKAMILPSSHILPVRKPIQCKKMVKTCQQECTFSLPPSMRVCTRARARVCMYVDTHMGACLCACVHVVTHMHVCTPTYKHL